MNDRSPGSSTTEHEPLRVLVIEDERPAQHALRLILQLDGYQVRTAGNGDGAIRILRGFKPHVVIMDWCLPGLSGRQLCDAVKRKLPDVPIIVVSSSDDAFSSEVDVTAKLRKPLDVRRLRTIVAERLARHDIQDTGTISSTPT